jgi:hypothetical protein
MQHHITLKLTAEKWSTGCSEHCDFGLIPMTDVIAVLWVNSAILF